MIRPEAEHELIDLATNYMSLYGINVNMARAIPFIKDGLKPIHRRILYAAYRYHGEKFVKTSILIGDVGKFSPHGDQGLNAVVAKMAQPFTNNIPLLISDGNSGNETTGDDFAAARYYSVSLSKFAMDILFDEFDGKVDMVPNYDGSLMEPFTFPAKFPLILLNGTAGIGYTLACDIPPYNLNEVADATIKVINFDKEFRHAAAEYCRTHHDELTEFLSSNINTYNVMTIDPSIFKILGVKPPKIRLIPDSPTKCDIIIKDDASFIMQSSYDIDNVNYIITIRNTPYYRFIDDIDKELRKIQDSPNPIPEIVSAAEESEDLATGFEYVIRCKPCNLMNIVNVLFKRISGFRSAISSKNMTVIDSQYRTRKFTAAQILGDWISQRFHTKRSYFLRIIVDKTTKRNMLEGKAFMLSPKNIDRTISVFKRCNRSELVDGLVAEYKGKVTTSQAAHVSTLHMYQITPDEHQATLKEIDEITKKIDQLREITYDDDKVKDSIIDDLLKIKKKYGTPRKSKILNGLQTNTTSVGVVNLLPTGNVLFSEVEDPSLVSSDVKPITGNRVCLIDNKGVFLWVETSNVAHNKEITLTSIGNHKMGPCIAAVSNLENNIILLTNKGQIKNMPISKIPSNSRVKSANPKSLIPLDFDEEIVGSLEVRDDGDDILIYTTDGYGKRIQLADIRKMLSPSASGQKIIKAEISNVAGLFTLNPTKSVIVYVTRLGRIRANLSKYMKTGKKYDDIKPIITLSSKDDLVSVFCCEPNQEITLYHLDGKISVISVDKIGITTINTPPKRPRLSSSAKIVRASIT